MGNVIGSNIFSMLWIFVISAIIKPLPFEIISNSDLFLISLVQRG